MGFRRRARWGAACLTVCCLFLLLAPRARSGEGRAEEAWWALFEAAVARQEAGDLGGALEGYAQAERYAIEKRLDPNYVKASIAGRIECFLAVYDYVRLRDTSLRMLEVARASGPPEDVFDTLLDLGYFENQLGDPIQALHWLGEAGGMVGDDPAKAADVALRAALALNTRGQLARALEAGEGAVRYFRRVDDRSGLVSALSIVALIYQGIGEVEQASACIEEAVQLVDDEVDAVQCADLLTTRGTLHAMAGELDRARERYADARAIFESATERLATANVISLDAGILERQGRLEASLAQYERALALGGASSPVRAGMELSVAEMLGRLGRRDEARAQLETCRKTAETGGNLGILASATALLALDHVRCDEQAEARAAMAQSLDALAELGMGLSPVTRAQALASRDVAVSRVERAAFDLVDAHAALELLDRTRATTITAGIGRTVAASPSTDAEVERAREAVAAALARRTAAYENGAVTQIKPAEAAYRAARTAYRDTLRHAQRADPTARLRDGEAALSLEAVQALLRPEDALVLYAFVDERLRAFVVEKQATRRVVLAQEDEVRPLVEQTRRAMCGPGELPATAPLADALIGRLELSAGVERLLVSPDDVLAAVPFAWIAKDREVVFVPSATAYGLLQEEKGLRGDGVLAMADPVYAALPGGIAPGLRSGALAPLEHSRAEAESIARKRDVVLLGVEATEDALRRVLPARKRWHALHFACHGLLDEQQPSWSALALTPTEHEDGLLSVIEVMGMRIPADLAVLSACETGLGKRLAGEGMLGLASAFLYAGAPRVVASLWKVDDAATQAFMQAFYAAWNPEDPGAAKGAAEALRLAREAVRSQERWAHPHYWAGWVLWGLPD